MKSSITALLALATTTLAEWKNLTASSYTLKDSGLSPVIARLDAALPNVYVKDIMADLNHDNPSASPNVKNLVPGSAYAWQKTSDFNDQTGLKWYPQGITTSADAYEKGDYDGFHVHLVSWHSDLYDGGKRGARISFVNRGDGERKYRHVLLVRPKDEDDFEAIDSLHAGGIMWYGNLLYVVSTRGGLLVFDLQRMYKVDTSVDDKVGKQEGGKYAAYGYKYVLPQVRSYDWQAEDGVRDLRFSFLSLDRTTTPDTLLVGEYSATRTDSRLVRWPLDYTTRVLKSLTATEAIQHDALQIQGAASIDGKYFLTQSGGALITHTWADGAVKHGSVFPSVPEDLSVEKGRGLWTLMEQIGFRGVVAVDVTKF
ncbi:hypothetical protein GQ43DRAFT_258431 [Delitschia confertaspora ATCC 74209]|uniref:Secreted protein n=1 Tax=Delitschia confertaspora ATCC 74209 TaxID=1513339 RepID=A0A9P4JPV6_9PLEO|nr:hypothetical protein GQ43DRAFT_258431 [Delitschia confertaspora ATCC 74209]